MPKKILVVDDETRMRKLVSDFLKKEGYTILEAENGRQALEVFSAEKDIDLIILDVMMPEYDGWAVCREIRKTSNASIIMLTARGEESDELFGFELGVDEYVKKPFSPRVLMARVNAVLNRKSNEVSKTRQFGALCADREGHYFTLNNERLDLAPKEYELLLYLVENNGNALSRDQILESVWDYEYGMETRTVDTHIRKLRRKLGCGEKYIQTVRNYGYRFEIP
ncbi:MAG: response regulator transcription factor [Spirochaetales bacterium]|uniref:Phosphate regulon transcriptional regulatory protein PhoB n=1 Tax=Candidatus Thalassospirochaeta sargassi TaxID=3119039 RepID=A0AAJ1II69_9SPIO|nr:response regulator transcription factor [Spirochaetales bacterium]